MMDCIQIVAKSFWLGILIFGQVICYPYGAPDSTCSTMMPNHGISASNIPVPYTITTSKSTYMPNEEITVILQGKSEDYNIKGFLIQPRQKSSISQLNTVGTITGDSETWNLCTPPMAALTHRNSNNKTTVNMTWKAPAEAVETVVFVATIVQAELTYWVNVQSRELTPNSSVPGGGGVTTPSPAVGTTVPSGGQFFDPACGKSKGCFRDSTFLVTWADNGGSTINFEMKASIPVSDNYWMSLGFSSDTKMGDDSVADCSVQSGVVTSHSSYNPGKSNEPLADDTYGINRTDGKVENGVFTCSFSRAKTVAVSSGRHKKRAAVSDATFFDLNEDWYLMFAHGRGPATAKYPHVMNPKISNAKADLQSVIDLAADSKKVDLTKVHGSLMIVAWIFLASIGTVMARFYKPVWPDSRIFGEKVWFQIHRACMVLVLFLVSASFVIIFIESDGYSETALWTDFQKAHPVLGIIIMALTVINPVMALFRPHPDAPRRKIFNIAHFGVGTVAFILAIINIFIGVDLDMSKNVENVLWAYVGWFIFIVIVLEIHDLMKSRKGKNNENYELTNIAEKQPMRESSLNVHNWKPWILAVHVVIILGLTIAMLILGNLHDED
ncbi:hypothetical protein CHS0354_000894 [Potamilus streckersoni]|uniref:Ferric-chelate reductase 1 n=1 Tax=Potamilus streckersoni TaxID=2493646 RepID=A0AAE0SIH7_9BIVA|nr:hypothetical protein CHS0354_000894 [Potamilus streckersoni]